jgi:hypothetical protein
MSVRSRLSVIFHGELVRRSVASCIDGRAFTSYGSIVSAQQLKQDAMALPLSERVSLAQALWESINAGLPDTDEQAAVRDAIRRDQELSSSAVAGRTHEEVMQAARRATPRPRWNSLKPSFKSEGPRGCRFLAWVRRRRGSISADLRPRGNATKGKKRRHPAGQKHFATSGGVARSLSRHYGTGMRVTRPVPVTTNCFGAVSSYL